MLDEFETKSSDEKVLRINEIANGVKCVSDDKVLPINKERE